MNQMSPEFLVQARQAFTGNIGITLQDVRDKVAALPASTRRRDALSALDAVPRLFKRDLGAVQAHWRSLRALFQSRNAAQLGIKPKSYANIRSEIIRAVKNFGPVSPAVTKRIALTPAWQTLFARIDRLSYGHALSRLACFCSVMGISPDQISQQTLLAFYEALVAEEVIKEPRRILKHTIAHWNMCGRRIPGWPKTRLSSPFPSAQYSLAAKAFPKSFQADLAKWRKRLLEVDVFSDDGPMRPLRKVTVDDEEKRILRFASALVLQGILTSDEVTSLRILVEPENLKQGLLFFIKRAGGKATGYIRNSAAVLVAIAKYHCKLEEAELKVLNRIKDKLGNREVGMTARNRERLAQFDQPKNIPKLLKFPMEERRRGLEVKNPYRRAKFFERALAAGILIYASLRMQNVHTIQIEKNIRYHQGVCILSFDRTETKNRRSHEIELPAFVTSLLQEFIKEHRHHLPGAEGPYLFPGKSGRPRSHNTMRIDFEAAVLKHTGLIVNPHLMRHVTSMIAIERDPANLPTVAQRLGHSGWQTCKDYYLGNETKPASRVLNRILEEAITNPKALG